SRCCPHSPPHSFPTRRSSDLAWRGAHGLRSRTPPTDERHDRPADQTSMLRATAPPPPRQREASPRPPPRARSAWTSVTSTRAPRSEEHTSELQSLAYLVCRLL